MMLASKSDELFNNNGSAFSLFSLKAYKLGLPKAEALEYTPQRQSAEETHKMS